MAQNAKRYIGIENAIDATELDRQQKNSTWAGHCISVCKPWP
jgi:hypothetical protein